MQLEERDIDDVDVMLTNLTQYLDDIGISRAQQRLVVRERQQIAFEIVDECMDTTGFDFRTLIKGPSR